MFFSLILMMISSINAIEYTTFGPNYTHPLGIDRLMRQSINQSASTNQSTTNQPTFFNNGLIDASIPVIRIGASWAEIREFNEFAGLESFLAFMIDYINFRGGIIINATDPSINPYPYSNTSTNQSGNGNSSINQPLTNPNGTRYYLSITFARNDASINYMKLIYSDLARQSTNSSISSQYSSIPPALINQPMPIVLAPPYEQLTVLAPLITNYSQTFLAVSNPDPASFPRINNNIFSMLVTGDLTYAPALNIINDKAKMVATQSINTTADLNSQNGLNRFGISTACLFAANDSLSQIYVASVRTWIRQQNRIRTNASASPDELIQIIVDAPWNPVLVNSTDYEIVYSDYVTSFGLCTDTVDLLIAIPTPSSGTIVANALRDSRIKPNAVLGLGYSNLRASNNGMASTNGWMIVNPVNLSTATYPGSCFKSAMSGITNFYNYAAAVPGMRPDTMKISVILYMGAVDMICGALTAAKGLDQKSMSQAFYSMNGKMAMFSAVRFSSLTGINTIVPANAVNQVINATSKVIPTASPQNLIYPYPWPWVKTVPGDLLHSKQDTSGVLVAIVICVLGAWVSLIVVEQAIFVRRKGGDYRPWLLVTAIALGGVALWCGFFQQSSGLALFMPDDGSQLDMQWSVNVAFLAFLPALLLTYIGLQIVILEIEDTTINQGSEAARVKQEMRLEREEKRKKAALDNRAHLAHLYQSLNWKSFLGGFFVLCAVMCTRVTLMYVWKMNADHTTVVWAWCATVTLKSFFIPLSVHLFFFAIRYRPIAAFIYAAACVGDWQIHLASVEFSYQPYREFPDALYSTLIDSSSVTIITGSLAAVTCFVFIGLQFSRMQLSRNGLSVLVASLESVIHQQRRSLKDDTATFAKMKNYIDHQCRVVECINLLSPFSSETAFVLASQTSMTSFVRLNNPSHNRRPSTLAKMKRVMHDRDGVEMSVNASTNTSTNHHNLVSTSHRNSPQIGSFVTPVNHITTSNNGFVLGQSAHSPDSGKKMSSADQSTNQLVDTKQGGGQSQSIARRKSMNQVVPLLGEPSTQRQSIDSANHLSVNRSPSNLSINQPEESPNSNVSALAPSDVGASQFLFTRTSIVQSIKPSSHSKPGEMSPPVEDNEEHIPTMLHSAAHAKGSINQPHNESLVRNSVFSSSQPINQSVTSSPSHQATSKLGIAHRANRSSQSSNQSITHSSGTSNKSLKTYEEDCIQLLEQIIGYQRDNFTSNKHVNGTANRSSLIGCSEDDTAYSFKLPLVLRDNVSDNLTLPVSASSPTLTTLLTHPVCVELLKQELQSIHSTENLMFWLHATRYRRCVSSRLRKLLAHTIYEQFIKEGSPQQININTRQRDAITSLVTSKRGEDAYSNDLFRESEHEVVLLMETNMMKSFSQTAKYRLCAWLCYVLPANIGDADLAAEFENAGSARGRKDSLLISSTNESQQSNNQSHRTGFVTRTRASVTHNDLEQSVNDVKPTNDVKRMSVHSRINE